MLEPFGSFQLGVAGPDADVDMVTLLAPELRGKPCLM